LAADPALWTLAEAAGAIAARRISSRELLRACLARIAMWQVDTNAFLDLREEQAWRMAEAADAGPPKGQLHGIPLAHKDMFYRAGQVSTCGSRLRNKWRAEVTASVLARLDAAGAVDLGTLHMAEWAGGATGHNPWYGDARNPWDPAFASGGSSSGSGAAVAARMVFGALGSDTGGSIRLPASMCGVAGLRPTLGAVSRFGAMARAGSLDTVGPLARTAQDCALMLAAIAGADGDDPSTAGAPGFAGVAVPDGLRGVVVGVERAMLDEADAALRPALDAALAVLRGLGAELVEVALPEREAMLAHAAVISGFEAAALHRQAMGATPEGFGADLFQAMQAGLAIPAEEYQAALQARGRLGEVVAREVFGRCAVLFCPSLAAPVPTREASRTRTGEELARVHGALVRMTRPFSLLGLPALALPCGFDARGLPVGFQLAGPAWGEAAILAVGMAYERAAGWHRHTAVSPWG
jgi:aspartyl-tRNA(Asn)/glutamyl-tRNA(Gln) amidotransferase subunit A